MKLSNLVYIAVASLAMLLAGCATYDPYYQTGNCGVYGCQQQTEQGAVAAIKEHGQRVGAINDPTLIPPGDCDKKDYGVVYSGTNGQYQVDSYGGQTCRGGPTSRAGITRPSGPDGVSYEECVEINFSIPQCGKYQRK